jgi:hypothetical protein
LINDFLTSDDVFPLIKTDFINDSKKLDISHILSDNRNYFMSNWSLVYGLFKHEEEGVYQAHVFVQPDIRGKEAIILAKQILRWMYENTDCKRMVGLTPEYHRRALVFARLVGFKPTGLSEESILKDGVLHNEVMSEHMREDL